MAYTATVIPIMIASPGDVAEERKIIREVIHEWNDINANASKVVLSPIGWETHSSPELGARPQELINKRVLKDCDILVGVFWTRIGSPTGNFKSGTVEEINEHMEAKKPVMLYFSSKPFSEDSIDQNQYQELKAFKKQCKELGLIEGYDTVDEFRSKFYRQLQICITKNPYIQSLIGSTPLIDKTEVTIDNKYRLSDEAQELLKAAASDKSGNIINARYIGGHQIQAGSTQFGGEYGRESAKWEGALKELVLNGLAKDVGYRGEVFELTLEGWKLADTLFN